MDLSERLSEDRVPRLSRFLSSLAQISPFIRPEKCMISVFPVVMRPETQLPLIEAVFETFSTRVNGSDLHSLP
jgi:hypothetical protein